MSTGLNVSMQLCAVLVAAAIRLALPAWITFLAVIFFFPLVVALLPLALAVGTKRWQRLSPAVAAPFIADAVFLVIVAALLPDTFGADYLWVPGLVVVGAPERDYVVNVTEPYYDTAILVGYFALLGYVAAQGWTIVAIILARRSRVTPSPARWSGTARAA
jgi:hypothetical protein